MALRMPLWTVLILSIVGTGMSQLRAKFGESCGDGIRCDSRASLSCVNSSCRCVKHDEMIYDTENEKCVVISGERCSYTAIETEDSERRYTQKLDCVTNANCNSDGYCGCTDMYFENWEGLCAPKGYHGANCTGSKQCRADLHLTCENGVCSCYKSEAIYDPTRQKCVGLVGTSCSKYDRLCAGVAVCNYRDYHGYNIEHSVCSCEDSHIRSWNGLCVANYDMDCNVDSTPCREDFSCVEGKCKCLFYSQQKFDSSQKKCISFVRGPCSEIRNNLTMEYDCVPNAECKNSSGIAECHCQEGYVESSERKCRVVHGGKCSGSSSCDSIAGLECIDGRCQCQGLQTFNELKNKCQGSVGAKCDPRNEGFCVDGAHCNPYRDPTIRMGVCRCNSALKSNSDRQCITDEVPEVSTTES